MMMLAITQGWIPEDLLAIGGGLILLAYVGALMVVGCGWVWRKIKSLFV